MYFAERKRHFRCVTNFWKTGGKEYPSLDAFKREVAKLGYAPPKLFYDPEQSAWVVKFYFVQLPETLGRPALIYDGHPRFSSSMWYSRGRRTLPVLVEVWPQEDNEGQ